MSQSRWITREFFIETDSENYCSTNCMYFGKTCVVFHMTIKRVSVAEGSDRFLRVPDCVKNEINK